MSYSVVVIILFSTCLYKSAFSICSSIFLENYIIDFLRFSFSVRSIFWIRFHLKRFHLINIWLIIQLFFFIFPSFHKIHWKYDLKNDSLKHNNRVIKNMPLERIWVSLVSFQVLFTNKVWFIKKNVEQL